MKVILPDFLCEAKFCHTEQQWHCESPSLPNSPVRSWEYICPDLNTKRLNPKVERLSPVDTIHGQNLAAGEQMDSTATDLKYMSSWLEQHIELTTDADPRYSVLFKSEWQGVYFLCDGISHDAKGTLLCLPKPFTGPFLPLNTRHSKPGICFSQVSICDGIRTTTGMQLLQKKRQLHHLF